MTSWKRLTPGEAQIAMLVWQDLTNRGIGKIIGTAEQVIKNHLPSTFDKLGVWSRLELAMYVARHGGQKWPVQAKRHANGRVGSGELANRSGSGSKWSESNASKCKRFA